MIRTHKFMVLLTASVALAVSQSARAAEQPAADSKSIPLWAKGAPGALGTEEVDIPTITVYPAPPEKATGAAIVVCPGGGYRVLAPHEAKPVAEWLNGLGITAVLLKYRLGPRYHHPAPLQDAARAVRTVRARAAEWKIDAHRIGILGFSAGGHLASTLGTQFDEGNSQSDDPIEKQSSRPDLMVLIYPAISFTADFVKQPAGGMLLGNNAPPELLDLLSTEKHVTSKTPPAFLLHTAEDRCEHSLVFALAMKKAGVPVELHLYERGKHGFGMGTKDSILKSWPDRCATWLGVHGFLAKETAATKRS